MAETKRKRVLDTEQDDAKSYDSDIFDYPDSLTTDVLSNVHSFLTGDIIEHELNNEEIDMSAEQKEAKQNNNLF